MAKHTGEFDYLQAKTKDKAVYAKSFIAYYSADGSTIAIDALPDDNSLITRGMLETAINGMGASIEEPVMSGSPIPFNLDLTETIYANGFIPIVEMVLSSTKGRIIYDVIIDKNYDAVTGLIDSIDIYGHDDGTGTNTTIDDLIVTLIPL